jgi:phytoene/squalene synthetase
MTLAACADIVRRGDPDRFLAAMAAPPDARPILFPLYAFNVEVSRAPWVTQEPLIAEMRLQWWRDALDEIAARATVRRHEVTLPLAEILDAEGAALLDGVAAARRIDVERTPFAGREDLDAYLQATGGTLAWAAARALGSQAEGGVRDIAWSAAAAAWLSAGPRLVALGREPLPAGCDPGRLAAEGLDRLRRGRGAVDRAARPALLFAWQAPTLLSRARRRPQAVADGTLGMSEFRKRTGLMRAALTGRV